MKQLLPTIALFAALAGGGSVGAQTNSASLDTKWIPDKPDVLTYRTTSPRDTGMFQLTIRKGEAGIETYINIITPGYTKHVSGLMTAEMMPLRSTGKIFVGDQVQMDNVTSYDGGSLSVSTQIIPANLLVQRTIAYSGRVVDPSQVPFMARVLPLARAAFFEFQSLNPQTNTLVPFSLKVVGEEAVRGIDCYKVEVKNFEGESVHWVEQAGRHRVVRMEQPALHRTTELLQ